MACWNAGSLSQVTGQWSTMLQRTLGLFACFRLHLTTEDWIVQCFIPVWAKDLWQFFFDVLQDDIEDSGESQHVLQYNRLSSTCKDVSWERNYLEFETPIWMMSKIFKNQTMTIDLCTKETNMRPIAQAAAGSGIPDVLQSLPHLFGVGVAQ